MKICLSKRVRRDAPHLPRPRRRALTGALTAVILVVTVAACDPPPENPPYWHPGTGVDATVVGPYVRIQWDATTGGDPAGSYQISLGTYTGTVVALVPASVRDCYISGLAASTNYTIVVTARDAQQHWSGPLPGTQGNRSKGITTSNHGGAGPNLWCHANVDTDGDRLPDGVETNSPGITPGTYEGAGKTGTSPTNPDTDNDGITDGDEVMGRTGLNLIAMGARPTHKDLMVEVDWLDAPVCPSPGLRPPTALLNEVRDAFAGAPVTNPDGTPGIKLVVDTGQGGAFTGGNAIPDADGDVGSPGAPTYRAYKDANHAAARLGIFHYGIIRNGGPGANGWAEAGGNDIQVEIDCNGSDATFSGDFMHELGHNMRLDHAGSISWTDNLPNYNSVMNWRYHGGQGVDINCDAVGDDVLDFSRGTRAPLDEAALLEANGVCDGPDPGQVADPIDWNMNGVIDPQPIQFDINTDGDINVIDYYGRVGEVGEVIPLTDHNDWQRVEDVGLRCVSPTHCPGTGKSGD